MDRARMVGVAAVIVLASTHARADAGDANDVRVLEKQLTEEHAALSTADCNAACRALGSIRRAADKICALEPGPRCDSAREKAADATRRVRDACPDCAIAIAPSQPTPTPPPEERAVTASRAAPESEARGGCRSCSVTDARGRPDLGLIVLAALTVSRLLSRRSRKDRRAL